MNRFRIVIALLIVVCVGSFARGFGENLPYTQTEDVVYAQAHGVALVMDVFTPKGEANGLAIIDVASGAWSSDRGKIRDHKMAQMYNIYCAKGYTVFAVRPGSISKFSAPEMVANLKTAIRWVKQRAEEYEIDPDRLGMTGASAGGHLASLAAMTQEDGTPGTKVAAVGVFFPPTDFLDWDGTSWEIRGSSQQSLMLRRLALPNGLDKQSDEELKKAVEKISPARLVHKDIPPILLIHGDSDRTVPLQQSQVFLKALKAVGADAELIVKPNGGHPWLTIHEEVKIMSDWFDKKLKAKE